MLLSYHGIIKEGQIQLQGPVTLPEGAQVLVVLAPPEAVETQERRLAEMSPADWQAPFDTFIAFSVQEEPPEIDSDTVSDDTLVDLIHQHRP